MNERIKEIRAALGISQEAFGSKLGIKKAAVSRIESGAVNLTETNIMLICEKFRVRREWLLTGSGEMFLPEATGSIDALASQYDLTPLEKDMLENYCKLSKAQRLAFWDVMQKIIGSSAQSGGAEEAESSGVAAAEAAYEKNFGTASDTQDAAASSTCDGTTATA